MSADYFHKDKLTLLRNSVLRDSSWLPLLILSSPFDFFDHNIHLNLDFRESYCFS